MDERSQQECYVCGSSNFYASDGLFFCNECHGQAQELYQTFVEVQENSKVSTSRSISFLNTPNKECKVKPTGGSLWTSWEGHNFVLIGLIDELISLGVDPKLKSTALQLWIRYLAKLEAAFISTTDNILPKFGMNQTAKDYAIVYGDGKDDGKELKALIMWPQKREPVSKARQPMLQESEHNSEDDANLVTTTTIPSIVLNTIDERLKRNMSPMNANDQLENVAAEVQFNKRTARLLDLKAKRLKNKVATGNAITKKGSDSCETKPLVRSKHGLCDSIYDPLYLTRLKVLALLVLALQYSNENIQIADLLRWIKEGHISYYKVTNLFPKELIFGDFDNSFTKPPSDLRHKSVVYCVTNLANLLEVKTFPTQNFTALAERYLLELQLPSELIIMIERLMASCHIDKADQFVCCESIAISFVIVVLKMLLGLDGQTEHRISDVAREINSMFKSDRPSCVEKNLFVWDDWVRYIECRKAVLIREHFPTKYKYDRDLFTSASPYVSFWHFHEDKYQFDEDKKSIRENRNRAHKDRIQEMKSTIEQLPDPVSSEECQFPPSLTPSVTYLKQILAHQKSLDCMRDDLPPYDILTYDHTETSMEYLSEPAKLIKYAHSKGLNVVVQESRAFQEVKIVPTMGATRSKALPKGLDIKATLVNDIDHDPTSEDARHSLISNILKRKASSLRIKPDNSSLQSDDCVHKDKPKKNKKMKHSKDEEVSGISTTRTLYRPSSQYWVLDMHNNQANSFFESHVEPLFPNTFCWLLGECSKLLEMKVFDLYSQVRLVERLSLKQAHLTDLKILCPRAKSL